jgi:hypothetical protein
VDRGRSGGAPWTHSGADRGHDGALTGAWPQASPELRRRYSDRAMAVQNREAAALGERAAQAWREGKGAGRGAVKLGEGARLL